MKLLVPLTVAVLLAVSGCGDDGASLAPAASPSPSPGAATGSPTPSASGDTEARAVYWLGATKEPRGPRLYREFVRRPATADAVRDAVTAMLSLEPTDPDYTSLWADGTTVRDVRREGATAVVDLSREATTNGGGSAFEEMSLQQLVHTVTAADPALTAVRLLVEGEPVETLWGSADASTPISRGPSYEVLGPVWLDVPDGSVLSGEFGGTATVFEATVSWQLRQGPDLVAEGFATATEGGPGRGTWTATADVPPG
ncbi:MAG: hypothetical protein EPN99_12235, partial [Frankiales bacterium]